MRKNGIYVLGIGLILVFVSLLCRNVWIGMQPPTDEQLMQKRETPYDVAVAFTTALRRNETLAYELAEPHLWPRIDNWMQENEPKKCINHNDELVDFSHLDGSTLQPLSYSITQECTSEDLSLRYYIIVFDIVVTDDGKFVSDWGKIESNG